MFVRRVKFVMGVTLMEFMMAMVLSLILMSVLLQLYLYSQKSYQLQQAWYQLQRNGNLVGEMLTSAVRKAGYVGCVRVTENFPLIPSQTHLLTMKNRLYVNAMNALIVRHASDQSVILKEKMTDNKRMVMGTEVHFSAGESLLISDCKQAEIIEVAESYISRDKQMVLATRPLHYTFDPYAQISRLEMNSYLVKKTNRKHKNGNAVYALYVQDSKGRHTELVEGVNKINIYYTFHRHGTWIETPAADKNPSQDLLGLLFEIELSSPPIVKKWYAYAALL
jgi:type IV pilus assembly protein PilW